MAKKIFEYKGKRRPEKIGTKKTFEDLTTERIKKLQNKGWVEVEPKAKAKKKK